MTPEDSADLRESILDLEKQMIGFGKDQQRIVEDVRGLMSSAAKHEAEDDLRFSRVESFLVGENGALPRISKIEDYFKAGRWAGRVAAVATITILGVMVYVLSVVLQMSHAIGAP